MIRGPLARILGAQALSSLGNSVTTVALAVMVFDRTGSVLHMGGILAASVAPLIVMSFVGGALLDRYDARRLMVAADVARAVLIMLMPWAARVDVGLIYVVAALMGVFGSVFNPSQVKLVGEIALPRDLVKSNSYLSIARDGAELGGYVVGGALVVTFGYTVTFIADGASYLVSALLLLGLPRAHVTEQVRRSLSALVRDSPLAVGVIFRRPHLRTNLLFALVPSVFILMMTPNAYALALEVFEVGATGFVVMEVGMALGFIVGGILASRIDYQGDRNRYVFWSMLCMSVGMLGVGLSDYFWLSVGLLSGGAVANVGVVVGSMTLFQEIEPRPDKGRIISVRAGFGQIATAVGLMAGGALGAIVGVRPLFVLIAIGCAVSATVIYLPYAMSPSGRRETAREGQV
ncbi:MAG: MFS transporter [Actinobacteria bacterium]|nr:MFS transporter [Actinomycetota bacterium]